MSINGDYSNPMFTRYLGPETGRASNPVEDVHVEKPMVSDSLAVANKPVDFTVQSSPGRTQSYDSSSTVGVPSQPATPDVSFAMLFDLFKSLLSMLSSPKEADIFDNQPANDSQPSVTNDQESPQKLRVTTTLAMGEGDSAPTMSTRPDLSDEPSGDSQKLRVTTTLAMGEGDSAPAWASKPEPSDEPSGDGQKLRMTTLAMGEGDSAPAWASKPEPSDSASDDSKGKFSGIEGDTTLAVGENDI